jgi:hypothetical protein
LITAVRISNRPYSGAAADHLHWLGGTHPLMRYAKLLLIPLGVGIAEA